MKQQEQAVITIQRAYRARKIQNLMSAIAQGKRIDIEQYSVEELGAKHPMPALKAASIEAKTSGGLFSKPSASSTISPCALAAMVGNHTMLIRIARVIDKSHLDEAMRKP